MNTRVTDPQRITAVLEGFFPNNPIGLAHYRGLLTEYAASGVGPPHLINELETRDEGKVWSCIWEAMLYRHLRSQGYNPKGSVKNGKQHGPDFRIEHNGKIIWIEAVVPAPCGIPANYLEPPRRGGPVVAKTKPDQERVLRCTSTIADKQKKFALYQAHGLIGVADCTVIAVNICRLSDWDFEGTGISQKPLSLEAVFPVGPLVAYITPAGKIDAPANNMPRFSVCKVDGHEIHTDAFFDETFENISAVIQAHQKDMYERGLTLVTIHNPLARVPLPYGLLHPEKEFVAQASEDGYQLRDVRLEARLRDRLESLTRRFRTHEDKTVRLVTSDEATGYQGERGEWYNNVNRWCFTPEHFRQMPVRGWLISKDSVLAKHSVVDIGNGEMIDVTPVPDEAERTFLVHDGPEEEFRFMPNQLVLSR